MSVKPAETRRLYLQIADKLRGLIEQQGFAPNGCLPSERELAQTLGVSRPSVREALVALELEGRVEIRMGSGVYIVAAPPAKPAASEAELGESPIEIMNARSVIEGAIAASVAPFAKPKELKVLRAVYETMAREVESGQLPMATDRAFHIAIAQMTGNDVRTHCRQPVRRAAQPAVIDAAWAFRGGGNVGGRVGRAPGDPGSAGSARRGPGSGGHAAAHAPFGGTADDETQKLMPVRGRNTHRLRGDDGLSRGRLHRPSGQPA